jgi:hypothetical protein
MIIRFLISVPLLALLYSTALSDERAAVRGVGTGSCADFGKAYKGDREETHAKHSVTRRRTEFCDSLPLRQAAAGAFFEVVVDYFDSLPEMPARIPN